MQAPMLLISAMRCIAQQSIKHAATKCNASVAAMQQAEAAAHGGWQ